MGFFDPFGLTKDGDMEAFKRRRATELKNGSEDSDSSQGSGVLGE